MDPKKLFADERFNCCVYCGGEPTTDDHVPSKVLLDKPYPANLPVVKACEACNNGFSVDEEYVACFPECVLSGSTDPESIRRLKIKRILTDKPALREKIRASSQAVSPAHISWSVEIERANNVVLKLARGHAAYELSEPVLSEPEHISIVPLSQLSPDERTAFETPPVETVAPELGSRAFSRITVAGNDVLMDNGWQVVQPGLYRYLVTYSQAKAVRVVLGEYLACEVIWL